MKSANCVYISSFERRAGSFGDYSLAFENVLLSKYDKVHKLDIAPYLALSDFCSIDRLIKSIEHFLLEVGEVKDIYVELLQYHSLAAFTALHVKQKLSGSRLIATVHDSPFLFQKGIHSYFPHKLFTYFKLDRIIDVLDFGNILQKRVVKQLDHIYFLSDTAIEGFQKKWNTPAEKLSSIHHVLLVDSEAPVRSQENECLTLYYTGSWWIHKGIELLLSAVEVAKKQHGVTIKLLLSGKCDNITYQEKIEGLIAELKEIQEVEYLGYESFEQIEQSSRMADCWVIPYVHAPKTACSGIMNLAISYNACLVSSDLPQFKEIITDRVNGRLFKNGDASHLAQIFIELAEEKNAMALAEGMRNGYRRKLTASEVAKQLV